MALPTCGATYPRSVRTERSARSSPRGRPASRNVQPTCASEGRYRAPHSPGLWLPPQRVSPAQPCQVGNERTQPVPRATAGLLGVWLGAQAPPPTLCSPHTPVCTFKEAVRGGGWSEDLGHWKDLDLDAASLGIAPSSCTATCSPHLLTACLCVRPTWASLWCWLHP